MQEKDRLNDDEIKRIVREGYAKIAKKGSSCCGADNSCCAPTSHPGENNLTFLYATDEIESTIESTNLVLGCGNPLRYASVKPGEMVVDLGCGAGFDVFLAAKRVGESGKVIGVDMTYEMLERGRASAVKMNATNVEFRHGEIENLPIPEGTADVVISNCVINLVPDKQRAFDEAFRILKPSGRLIVSDIVLLRELPSCLRGSPEALIGCVAGAELKSNYVAMIKKAGFTGVEILNELPFPSNVEFLGDARDSLCCEPKKSLDASGEVLTSIISITIRAYKSAPSCCCG